MHQLSNKPSVEILEDRSLPATFGVPWPDALHLSLSWVPDGTSIAGQTTSNLFAALNAQKPTVEWQRDFLRALQTWAAVANINVGITSDNGQALGSLFLGTTSPFGDIRVAAQGMTTAELAVSIPHDPFLSGSWSGDVFLNSYANLYSNQADLYSIALHELGHVFGLSPNANPDSVMYNKALGLRTSLAASDITAIRALYGARAADLNEGSKTNNTFDEATRLKYEDTADEPGETIFDGSTPLIGYGDITTKTDIDMYYVRPLDDYTGPMTVRLQTQGISLLAPRLSVYDEDGNLLGQVQGNNPLGSEVEFTIENTDPDLEYFFRVEAATADEFAIGRYALAVSFDNLMTTPDVNIQAVVRGAYEGIDEEDIIQLLHDPSTTLLNEDDYTNERALTAIRLQGLPGVANPVAFQTIGSVQGPTDVDFYRFRAPLGLGPTARLLISLRKTEVNGLVPRLQVYNQYLQPLTTTILANGNGSYSVQVPSALSGQTYFLRVFGEQTGSTANGNYQLKIQFLKTPVALTTLSQGNLNTTTKQSSERNLYVAQTQLFHLLLTANNLYTTNGAGIRVTLLDASGNSVYELSAMKGQSVSGPQVLLMPGTYKVRYSIIRPLDGKAGVVRFMLAGANLSDPIGPKADDPTRQPIFSGPNPNLYYYPNNVISQQSYFWGGSII